MSSWDTVISFCLMSCLCAVLSAQAWKALHSMLTMLGVTAASLPGALAKAAVIDADD